MQSRYRLKKNEDFARVYKKGRRFYNRDLTIVVADNGLKSKRFGFTLTRKFGKANKRNKVRRRLKEIIRANIDAFEDGKDYIIVPKSKCIDLEYDKLEKTLLHCLAFSKKKRK